MPPILGFATPATRRRCLLAACALAGLACLPACRGPRPPNPLKVSHHAWPGYAFLPLARDAGWLAADQVRLVEVPSASDSLHALAAGIVDAATLTLDEVLRARAGGLPLTVVLVFNISAGADMLIARPDYPSLTALAGHRIGVESSATGGVMLAAALAAAQLPTDAVQLVPLGIHEHELAWQQGKVDALITYEPVATRILACGARMLFDSRAIPDTILDVLAVRSTALDEQAPAIHQLIGAHFRAQAGLKTQRQHLLAQLGQLLGLSPLQVEHVFDGMVLPDAARNRALLSGKPPHLIQTAALLARQMQASGLLPHAPSLDKLVDDRYLPGGDR